MRYRFALVICAACRASSLGYLQPPLGNDDTISLGHLGDPLARALKTGYRGQLEHPHPPVSLAPSDGSELALRSLSAQVQIEGPLAHTELHFTFANTEDRVREGRFVVAMPDDAAVSRFAMKIDTGWREARIVSRAKGREVYETFLHQRVDPALLERDADNRFSARVFPIAPKSDKEIIIAYDHVISAARPYVLPLRGLPAVPVAIAIDRDGVTSRVDTTTKPDDLVIGVAREPTGISDGRAFVARIEAPAAGEPAALDRVLILVDTSASRASIMGRQGEAVRELLARLAPEAVVAVAAYDQDVTEVYRGRAGNAGFAADRVLEHGALGGSNLGRALAYAATAGYARVIILGDAVATFGERDAGKLAAIAAPIGRVDLVKLGQTLAADTAHAVVAAGKSPGAILDGRDLARVAGQLAVALDPERPIRVAGAAASWPETTRGVAPGDSIWVFGLLETPTAVLDVRIGDRTVRPALRASQSRRIRRTVAAAELADLSARLATAEPAQRSVLRADIEKLALANDLVSSETSLLTLENDQDEERMLAWATQIGSPVPEPMMGEPDGALLGAKDSAGEVMTISASAPSIDQSSASLETLINKNYFYNMPIGNTFREAVEKAAGGNYASYGVEAMHSYERREPDYNRQPYTGKLRDVMTAIAQHRLDDALAIATAWRVESPEDVAAIIALGEALEARGARVLAARAYGSLVDLYPSRDEMARAAGERLDRIGGPALALAIDAYRRAIDERPDRPVSYRRLAWALVRAGRRDEAIDVLIAAIPKAQWWSVQDVLRQDLGLLAAAAIAKDPATPVAGRVRALGITIPTSPSVRFALVWETDANDVDLHVHDRSGHHAYFIEPTLPTGGGLLDDLTDGFGPELFEIESPTAFPYQLSAHYYRRGPEGVGLGDVQIIRHDGHGNLAIEDRPFVIQQDNALVELGSVYER
jgi:tetratricopeptide (TPR) repeat protein